MMSNPQAKIWKSNWLKKMTVSGQMINKMLLKVRMFKSQIDWLYAITTG